MPRLFHTPPKYRLHKSTKQAIIEFGGRRIYLGPFGSKKSHQLYQEILGEWRSLRHQEAESQQNAETQSPRSPDEVLTSGITAETLRQKRRQGLSVDLNELILVFKRHGKTSPERLLWHLWRGGRTAVIYRF